MSGQKRLFLLLAIMTTVTASVVGVALFVLYDTAFEQQLMRLVEMAQSQARLIEAIARHNTYTASWMRDEDPKFDPYYATLQQIREAHANFEGFGETGEFTLARIEGDRMIFLLRHRHHDSNQPKSIPFESEFAEPMRRALSGESGTIVGIDYRGEKVLAAYEPVSELNMGIVAKIDLAEVRAPFIKAGLMAGGIAVLFIFLGTALFLRVGYPIVRSLSESEERFRTAFDQAGDALFLIRPDGRFVDVNQRACDILGYTREELLELSIPDIDPDYNKEKIVESLKSLKPESPVTVESIHRRKDGTTFPVEIRTGLIDLYGKPHMLSLAREITERKKTEMKIKQIKESYERLIDNADEAIFRVKADGGHVVFLNEAAIRIFGYSRAEWLNDPSLGFKIIHPDYKERQKQIIEEISAQKETLKNVVLGWIAKDGHDVIMEYTIMPIIDKEGRIEYFESIGRDITKSKKAEEALKKSERRYQELFDLVMEGIGILDEKETIEFCNPAYAKIFEEENTGDLIGKSLFDYVPEDQRELVLCQTAKRINGETSQYEMDIITAKGNKRAIFVSISPRFDKNGHYTGALGAVLDISERKQIEQQKMLLQEQLTRAEKMESLGLLAGGVAHDLNNILGPLVAYPELIKMKLPPDSPIRENISKIESSAQRAAEVVQDLLTLARRGKYNMVPLDLNQIVDSYLQSPDYLNIKSKHPNVKIDVELDRNIPNVNGSTPHLSKVVMNLIINAFDALRHGGTLKVKTECKYIQNLACGFSNIEKGKYVILTVSDTGVGINKKDMEHIFEPFYTKKEMGLNGSGLGLSVVYGVIKDHNGYIDVISEVGRGTEFIIYLPVIGSNLTEKEKIVADIRGSEKILVVDDVAEQRELAAAVLSSLGYNVDVVGSGREAVEYLKNNQADVVILDMIMEACFDGLDTYREIVKIHPGQKAIIASGFSETHRVKQAEKLGVGRYIRKPYTMQILGKAIRQVIAD